MNIRVFKHSFYSKMFIYIAILVLVIILTLSFAFFFNFENVGLRMQSEANKNILSEISYSATYLNDTARNTAAYIYSNNDYSALRYGGYSSYEDRYKLIPGLEALVSQSNNVIHSIYIYNSDINTYYSTLWRFYSDSDEFMDRDIVYIIENNKIPGKVKFTSNPLLRKVPEDFTGANSTSQLNILTYILADYSSDKKHIQSAIIINIRSLYLDGLINTLNTKGALTGGDTFILSDTGHVVASSNSGTAFSDLSDKPYINKILSSEEADGYFIDKIDDKKVVATFVSSDILDWKFVNITPYNQIFEDINSMKARLYIMCLIIILLGFILSFLLSKYLYNPINSMIGKVRQLSDIEIEKTKKNELDFLSDILADAIEKTKKMQSLNYENYMIKRNRFLRDLLINESLSKAEVNDMFSKYKIGLNSDGNFLLCNFGIDRFSSFSETLSHEDQKLFRFAICNVVGEMALKCGKNECFELDEQNIALIIEAGSSEQKTNEELLISVTREIQDWCQANLNISLSAAINTSPAPLMDISESYRFTTQLSKYKFVYGNKALLLPEVIFELKTTAFEHPISFEQKLDESLNAGKLVDSVDVYKKIIEYITDYSYETINSYILYLSYLLIRKMNDLEAKGYEKIVFDSGSFIKEIISFETLEEINARVISLFEVITDTITQKRFRRKSSLAERVKTIIETEYADKSLCQDAVAARLNISRDYLGKIFREAYSKSFADYLTEVRLQKAVEYMENGKKSIAGILDKIGWENKNYFYTTFKLKYGITTSQFRNMSLNKQN